VATDESTMSSYVKDKRQSQENDAEQDRIRSETRRLAFSIRAAMKAKLRDNLSSFAMTRRALRLRQSANASFSCGTDFWLLTIAELLCSGSICSCEDRGGGHPPLPSPQLGREHAVG
jgi:hypothetical protein